jgi:hypothetical protein
LPYDLTDEENKAVVDAEVKAHFAPKPPPPPKKKVPKKVIQHFIDNAQPAIKHTDSDYERSIRKVDQALQKKESSSSSSQAVGKKSGKAIPQLGEQVVQSIPPLIVQTHVSTAHRLVITDDHRRQAKEACLTVEQLLGIEQMPVFKEEELR